MEHVKCLIIGSGPAGYTAAIYASRANLKPVEYCGLLTGGQLTQTTMVENFPGYPQGVLGGQMMNDIREQAERFGADIRDGIITKVDFSKAPYKVTTEEGVEIEADTVMMSVWKEYFTSIILAFSIIPILRWSNRAWFDLLVFSGVGKMLILLMLVLTLLSAFITLKINKPL